MVDSGNWQAPLCLHAFVDPCGFRMFSLLLRLQLGGASPLCLTAANLTGCYRQGEFLEELLVFGEFYLSVPVDVLPHVRCRHMSSFVTLGPSLERALPLRVALCTTKF